MINLQADLQLCDLPEFDETSKVQKQYNRLSWYLIAIIVFYAIPAYQLVLTYQQVPPHPPPHPHHTLHHM